MSVYKKKGLSKKRRENKGPSVFDFLNDITNGKTFILNEDNEKYYSKFMITKWMSVKPEYIKIAAMLNKYQGVLDKYEFHRMAMSFVTHKKKFFVSAGSSPFFKIPIKEIREELVYIADHFNITLNDAYNHYMTLNEQEREEIIKKIKLLQGIVEK